jgi:3'-phosphoadenosine 5'-phosphosulfate sulfotransferase (PAPS reductase)/FAD synthetase
MHEKIKIDEWYSTNGKAKYWRESLDLLVEIEPRSLSLQCPNCGKKGLPTTKWEKGLKEKPLYIIHNNGGSPYACYIKNDSKELRGNIEISKTDLRKIIARAKSYVLFSGGKDSLCTLVYLDEIAKSIDKEVTALHIDTTAGFPEVTTEARKICRKLGVPLKILKSERDFFQLAKRWGIPSFKSRWCCKELKIKPVRNFLSKIQGRKVIFDGIRAAESPLRKTYLPVWYHPTFKCLSISPIFLWSDERVKNFLKSKNLPQNPTKQFDCSVECWCGAYKKRSDFEKLLEVHPDIFEKLVQVEKAQKGKFTYVYENGQQISLEQVRRNYLDGRGN